MGLVEETIKAYEFSAQEYISKNGDVSVIKEEADMFISNLNGMNVLDIGCGPGRDAKYFSDIGLRVTGIDLVPEFIETACKKVPNGIFHIMDMREMDFQANYFDGIWSMASFLHIPRNEANKTMREHARVLKPRGTMFISVMEGNGNDPLPASPKYGGHSKFFYGYGEEEFRNLLTSSGFLIEYLERDKKSDKLTFFNVLARRD